MGLAMPPASPSRKRSILLSDFETSTAKRLQSHIRQHHNLKWSTESIANGKAFAQDHEAAEETLSRSISLALQAVGFERAEPVAIDALRQDAEEYMSHFLLHVRQTMLACRRSRPIPEDFLQALHLNSLSLTALLPHLDPPVPSSASQKPLTFDTSSGDDAEKRAFAASSAQTLFQNQDQEQRSAYIPSHFPALPGKHSYRETIELPTRERDPKRIREQATEEGRLGEEALRRLLSSRVGRKAELSRQQEDKGLRNMSETMRLRVKRQKLLEEAMQIKSWDETGKEEDEADQADAMEIDLGNGGKQTDGGDLAAMRQISSGVNYEKKYWRKVPPQRAGGGNDGGG